MQTSQHSWPSLHSPCHLSSFTSAMVPKQCCRDLARFVISLPFAPQPALAMCPVRPHKAAPPSTDLHPTGACWSLCPPHPSDQASWSWYQVVCTACMCFPSLCTCFLSSTKLELSGTGRRLLHQGGPSPGAQTIVLPQ